MCSSFPEEAISCASGVWMRLRKEPGTVSDASWYSSSDWLFRAWSMLHSLQSSQRSGMALGLPAWCPFGSFRRNAHGECCLARDFLPGRVIASVCWGGSMPADNFYSGIKLSAFDWFLIPSLTNSGCIFRNVLQTMFICTCIKLSTIVSIICILIFYFLLDSTRIPNG